MPLNECYKILNVSPGAEWEEVKRAYRDLAKQFHPDRNPRASEAQFKQISESFHRLELYYKK
ncbi:MAG: DnaJ domain-containing protein, partial [Nitrospinales bacterium]